MNKGILLATSLLVLVVCAAATELTSVIKFIKETEDSLKFIGLVTICYGIVKCGEKALNGVGNRE